MFSLPHVFLFNLLFIEEPRELDKTDALGLASDRAAWRQKACLGALCLYWLSFQSARRSKVEHVVKMQYLKGTVYLLDPEFPPIQG